MKDIIKSLFSLIISVVWFIIIVVGLVLLFT